MQTHDPNRCQQKWVPAGRNIVDETWPVFPPRQMRAITCVGCDQLAVIPAQQMDDLCPACMAGSDQLGGMIQVDELPAPATKFVPKYMRDQAARARTCPGCGTKSTRPVCSCRSGKAPSAGQAGPAPAMRVGATIIAADRDNYGTVLSFTPAAVIVLFVNNERGTVARVELPRRMVTVVR